MKLQYEHLIPRMQSLYVKGMVDSEIAEALTAEGDPISTQSVYKYLRFLPLEDKNQHKAARVLIKRDRLRPQFLEDAKALNWTDLSGRYRRSEHGQLLLREYFPERFEKVEKAEEPGEKKRVNHETRKLILQLLNEGASNVEIGNQLGLTRERVRQVVESMQNDPDYASLMPEALQQRETKRGENRQQQLEERIAADAFSMGRSGLLSKYGHSENIKRIVDALYPQVESDIIEEHESYVGQEINGFRAVEFLGRKKPDGSFSKQRKDFTGNPNRTTFYYKVVHLSCGRPYARQKHTFIKGQIGCVCKLKNAQPEYQEHDPEE